MRDKKKPLGSHSNAGNLAKPLYCTMSRLIRSEMDVPSNLRTSPVNGALSWSILPSIGLAERESATNRR